MDGEVACQATCERTQGWSTSGHLRAGERSLVRARLAAWCTAM